MAIRSIIIVAFLLVATLAIVVLGAPQSNQLAGQWAGNAATGNQPVGKLQPHLSGSGAGNNGRNWGAHGNFGVGVKAWESQNGRHAVGVGANYGQSAGRFQGQSWRGRPDVGVGAGYRYRFGG